MKRIILPLLLAIVAMKTMAQVVPDSINFDANGEFAIVGPTKADARQTFLYSRAFFTAQDFKTQTEIVMLDSVAHKVQVSARIDGDNIKFFPPSGTIYQKYVHEHFLLTITAKDGRFKAKVESPAFEFDLYTEAGTKMAHVKHTESHAKYAPHVAYAEQYANMTTLRQALNKNRATRYASLLNSLLSYIDKQLADDDF